MHLATATQTTPEGTQQGCLQKQINSGKEKHPPTVQKQITTTTP